MDARTDEKWAEILQYAREHATGEGSHKGYRWLQDAFEEYFNDHAEYFDEGKFERLRRITGYLVGTLDRWNDAKKAEEAARVKHCVNSAIDDAERLAALETQAMEQNIAYAH